MDNSRGPKSSGGGKQALKAVMAARHLLTWKTAPVTDAKPGSGREMDRRECGWKLGNCDRYKTIARRADDSTIRGAGRAKYFLRIGKLKRNGGARSTKSAKNKRLIILECAEIGGPKWVIRDVAKLWDVVAMGLTALRA